MPSKALIYHHSTCHSPRSVRAGARFLDFSNKPEPYKRYRKRHAGSTPSEFALLEPAHLGQTATLAAIAALPASACSSQRPPPGPHSGFVDSRPGSHPCFLDASQISAVLGLSCGEIKRKRIGGELIAFRAAPCTGALYHVECYLASGEIQCVDGAGTASTIPPGLFHYDPAKHCLRLLRDSDFRPSLLVSAGVDEAVAEALVLEGAVVFCFTSSFWRNAWKYGPRTYRHSFWDTGTVVANAMAVLAALGCHQSLHVAFVDETVAGILGIDLRHEAPTALLVAYPPGAASHSETALPQRVNTYAKPREATRSEKKPGEPSSFYETVPFSKSHIDYEEIEEVRRATDLDSVEDVTVFGSRAVALFERPQAGAPAPDHWVEASTYGFSRARLESFRDMSKLASGADLQTTIVGRRSTRSFGAEPISRYDLAAILQACSIAVPADFLGTSRLLPRPRPHLECGIRSSGDRKSEDSVERSGESQSTAEVGHSGDRPSASSGRAEKRLASREPSADDHLGVPFRSLLIQGLVVNSVEGIEPGAYLYFPLRQDLRDFELRLCRAGNFRSYAGFLALEQPAAALAAVDIFHLADFAVLTERLGERAYRAAQLEGGIRGGLCYLAAHALGLRACGLTFYDHESVRFFFEGADGGRRTTEERAPTTEAATHLDTETAKADEVEERLGVAFLVAMGHRRRRGKVTPESLGYSDESS